MARLDSSFMLTLWGFGFWNSQAHFARNDPRMAKRGAHEKTPSCFCRAFIAAGGLSAPKNSVRQLLVCRAGTLPGARQSWSGVAVELFQVPGTMPGPALQSMGWTPDIVLSSHQ